jgi:molybdenum cofactor synthesis domain-containing protein
MGSVAAIIIGDEILSGKVADTNTGTLIGLLRGCGLSLERVVVIGDDPHEIGHEVLQCSERFDWVLTSGGVGPTHDDRTIEGIARAFDRPITRPEALERAVRAHFGDRVNEAALKLAEVPEGAKLLDAGPFPIVLFENVYILPGVPHIFEDKLRRICANFSGTPPVLRRIFLQTHESTIADILRRCEDAGSGVRIGSYPRFDRHDHNLMVTIEATEVSLVDRAVKQLLARLPTQLVIRVE